MKVRIRLEGLDAIKRKLTDASTKGKRAAAKVFADAVRDSAKAPKAGPVRHKRTGRMSAAVQINKKRDGSLTVTVDDRRAPQWKSLEGGWRARGKGPRRQYPFIR